MSVYLDGKFAFGLALIHALWLRVGQHLSDEEILDLQEADTLEKAKQRAIGLIAYRPRSVDEVKKRLQKAGVDADTIADVVKSLQTAGLLDDDSFSKAWVESRLRAKPRSKRMIAWELRQKGVQPATVEESIKDISDEESAYQLALRRWPRVSEIKAVVERRRKLSEYLARHGFTFETIQDVIARIEAETGIDSQIEDD